VIACDADCKGVAARSRFYYLAHAPGNSATRA
jgi:hypothetical protein